VDVHDRHAPRNGHNLRGDAAACEGRQRLGKIRQKPPPPYLLVQLPVDVPADVEDAEEAKEAEEAEELLGVVRLGRLA
jgi:hypothetical protein